MFAYNDKTNTYIPIPEINNIKYIVKPDVYDFIYSPPKGWSQETIALSKTKMNIYNTSVKEGIYKETYDFINEFLSDSMKQVYKDLNSYYKIGLLFYGSPGTGKTIFAAQIAQKIVNEYNGIGIIVNTSVDPTKLTKLIDNIRIKDKNIPIVVILDEFEKMYRHAFESSELLSFLDGTNSRDNLIIIATANDIKELPKTLLERPGRFEKTIKFTIKDKNVLKNIVSGLLPTKYRVDISVDDVTDNLLEDFKNKNANKLGLNVKSGETTIDYIKLYIRDAIYLNNLDKSPEELYLDNKPAP